MVGPGGAETGSGHTPHARSHRRRREIVVLAAGAALVAGSFGGGVVAGWNLKQDAEVIAEGDVLVQVTAYGEDAEAAMPDVRGLPEDAAREALADAGVPRSVLTVERRPDAGIPGTVVIQTPAFGAEKPERVVLTLADPAEVPTVVDASEAEATRRVEELGARVVIEGRYEDGKEPGTVLAVRPEAGESLPDEVVLVVAEAPSAIFLDAIRAAEGNCATGIEPVNGLDREHSVVCDAEEEPLSLVYFTRGAVQRLSGFIGVPDGADPRSRVRVEIFANEKSVEVVEAGYGAPQPIKLDLGSAVRLEFRISRLSPEPTSDDCCPDVRAALADIQLIGAPEAIAALTEAEQ